MSAEQTSPTTEERIAFKRAELHRGHWCDDCATLARQQALTDAIAEAERIASTLSPSEQMYYGIAAVIDTLTRLRDGS